MKNLINENIFLFLNKIIEIIFYYDTLCVRKEKGGREMKIDLSKLETENRNPHSLAIDSLSVDELIELINREDETVSKAVKKASPAIEKAIQAALEKFKTGGRIIYIGAGTSGRLGVLDAVECLPTYGVSEEYIFGILAGGVNAMFKAVEGAEDSKELAIEDLKHNKLTSKDCLIGIAASGRTPYVIGALEYANSIGAETISVSCVSNSEVGKVSHYPIEVVTGPEVVTGSTRMKAGTAQKMVLNMISTILMIQTGKVYSNLMVDVKPTNEKLVVRAKNIIKAATNCDDDVAEKTFIASEQNVKVSILMILLEVSNEEAKNLLVNSSGKIYDIVNQKEKEGM